MKLQYTVSDDKKLLEVKYVPGTIPSHLFSELNRKIWATDSRCLMKSRSFVDPSNGFRYTETLVYGFFNRKPEHIELIQSYEIISGPDIDIENKFKATFKDIPIELEKVGFEDFDELVLNDLKLVKEGRIAKEADAHLESADEAKDCITKESTLVRGRVFC